MKLFYINRLGIYVVYQDTYVGKSEKLWHIHVNLFIYAHTFSELHLFSIEFWNANHSENWHFKKNLTLLCMKYFCNATAWNATLGTHKRKYSIN